ncbi:MAG TPA: hypothetical protein VF471_08950 [Pseudoxanthomonas sp.]
MTRSEIRRKAKAKRAENLQRDAVARKVDIAKRKAMLHQAFRERHRLQLTFRDRLKLLLAMFFAATGGPLYPWLPDELKYSPYRRKRRDRRGA